MEKALQAYLREGEQVRWQGGPKKFPLLEEAHRTVILRLWIATAACVGGLLVGYLTVQEARNMGFIGLMLLMAAVIILSPVSQWRKLLAQRYFITDQRAIVMLQDKTFCYMELPEIDAWKVVQGMSAEPCLVLGSDVFGDVEKHLRWRACRPKEDPQGAKKRDCVDGIIFYGVERAEAVAAMLEADSRNRAA